MDNGSVPSNVSAKMIASNLGSFFHSGNASHWIRSLSQPYTMNEFAAPMGPVESYSNSLYRHG